MGFLLYAERIAAFPPFAFLSRAFPLLPPLLPAGYLYVWDAVDSQSPVLVPRPLNSGTHLMMAQTSPAKFLRQAVDVRYSCGFSR